MHISVATRLLILGLLLAAASQAQFPQYTAPGSLAIPETPTREQVEASAENARWNFGAVKVDPRVWMRDFGYNDNVFGASDERDKVSDLTVSVGAGLVGYSHFGPDVIVSAYVLPEYTWWRDLDQLRDERLSYGAGIFGFFNRLRFLIDARRDERQRFINGETLVPFNVLTHLASIDVVVDLRGAFELFAVAEAHEFEHGGSAIPTRLELLDRDEEIGRAGVAYVITSDLRVGLGVEYSEANFDVDPSGRSNRSFGPLMEVEVDRDALSVNASAVVRNVDFSSPTAPSRSELTGKLRAGWAASRRLSLDVYGGRSLVYSVVSDDQFFIEDRVGLSVGTPWGRRLQLRVYGESGTNRYSAVSRRITTRVDDVTSWGTDLDVELARRFMLTASVSTSEFDSSQPGLDRTVTVLRLGVELGGDPRPW